MKFGSRIAIALALLLGGATILLVGGLAEIARSADRELSRARALHGLETIVSQAERVLGLGLSIRDLKQIDGVLERVVGANDGVLAAEVFDPSGVSLVSSDRGALGEPVPQPWLRAMREVRRDGTWTFAEGDTRVVGTAIVNDFGVVAGQAVLILRRAPPLVTALVEARGIALGPLLKRWYLVPFAVLLGLVAGGWLGRVLAARAERLRRAFESGQSRVEGAGLPATEAAMAAAGRGFAGADADIADARRRLAAIDGEIR